MLPQFAATHTKSVKIRCIAWGGFALRRLQSISANAIDIKHRAPRKGEWREARVRVQTLSTKCPFWRRHRAAFIPLSVACDIGPRRRFRAGMRCLSLVLLCGCTPKPAEVDPVASAPPARLQPMDPAPQITQSTTPRKTADKRWQHKSHFGTRQAEILAAIEPSALLGKEPSAVQRLLGSPADISKRDVSLIWTYGSADCAFQVYFYPDIKTSMFHALQYAATRQDGEKIDLSQGCIQRLLIARK